MSTNSYLKDWESYSAITKTQGDILGDIQRLIEADSNLPPNSAIAPSAAEAKNSDSKTPDELQEQFADKLEEREKELEVLLETVSECKSHINSLKKFHDDLMSRTNDFQSKCGSILKEQKTLLDISDELSRSLEFYKEVDNIARLIYKKPAAALLSDANFFKTIDTLEEAEGFFVKNADYLDSKEYLAKISNVKHHLSEIVQNYIQQVATDQYIQSLPADGVTSDTLAIYRACIYSSIPLFDSIKPVFTYLQEFANKKSVPDYVDTIDSVASSLFTIRKGLITEICDHLVGESLKLSNLSSVSQKLLQIQAQMSREELEFFQKYFLDTQRMSKDVMGHFEAVMYNYLRPLIIKESDVKELSTAIVFTKKAFFDQSVLFADSPASPTAISGASIDKKFLTKVNVSAIYTNDRLCTTCKNDFYICWTTTLI